jgi:hypothetical protein
MYAEESTKYVCSSVYVTQVHHPCTYKSRRSSTGDELRSLESVIIIYSEFVQLALEKYL